jgi:hypothetical protein
MSCTLGAIWEMMLKIASPLKETIKANRNIDE